MVKGRRVDMGLATVSAAPPKVLSTSASHATTSAQPDPCATNSELPTLRWAVAGLSPSLAEIPTAQLPTGAILGQNGYGKQSYSICPAKGQAETYVFALYALPQALSPQRGFDAMSLRKEVLGIAGNVGLVTAAFGR